MVERQTPNREVLDSIPTCVIVLCPLGCVHIEIYGIWYMVFAIRYSVFAIRYTGTAVHIEVARAVSVLFREYEKSCKFGVYIFMRIQICAFIV